MAGFGRSPFGHGPFGRSDLGKDQVVDLFPTEYFSNQTDITQDPMYHFLQVMANSVNLRRIDADNMQTLTDYDAAPLYIVQLYGQMFGLDIDKNDPDFLQRSLLKNAPPGNKRFVIGQLKLNNGYTALFGSICPYATNVATALPFLISSLLFILTV